jgi:transcriptional regulator with XRE-family HTH domain
VSVPASDAVKKAIGERIRGLRKQLGLSQMQVAERTTLGASYIGALERGERAATVDTLGSLAAALETTLGELVAAEELHLSREVEALLKDVPDRSRLPMLRVVRETVLYLRGAAHDVAGRRTGSPA